MKQKERIESILTENAPAPIGPYAQGVRAGGVMYTAGQIGLRPDGTVPEDLRDQARVALSNLVAVLEAGGANVNTVLKTTIFLTDMGDFSQVNDVYATFFSEHSPARSTVEVSGLPKGVAVEIEAVALVAEQG